jgi:hypothetical protein
MARNHGDFIRSKQADEWQANLRNFSMKVGFHLSLSTAMLEMLCATADDVRWDRGLYWKGRTVPENWIASQASLCKRGLIIRKSDQEIDVLKYDQGDHNEWALYRLTPAGDCVVKLLKMAGLFVEADASINKKSRKKARA